MTTPTPRCDAVAKQIGALAARWKNRDIGAPLFSDLCEHQLDHLRQLETELAEARAERDALANDVKALRIGKCTCNCGKEVMNAWRDQDGYHCLTCLAKERDKAEADLTRLRAVADELAGALKEISGQPTSLEMHPNDVENGEFDIGYDQCIQTARNALARYHAATNPASVAANTGVNHRTG